MAKFVLVHVYHSSYNSFHMGNHSDPCQSVLFLNNLLVMKNSHYQQFMPNLCYIIYIDLCIGAFSSQTTFNDPMPNSIYVKLNQNNGRVVSSPLSFVLLAFSRIFPMGGWGGPEKDQKLL